MGESETTGVDQWEVRLGQIAIILLVIQPLASFILNILGPVLVVVNVGGYPVDIVALVVTVLALAILVYLRARVGRRWLFRLYPRWISKWPHMRVVYMCFGGLLLWGLFGVTVLAADTALYRLGYSELVRFFFLELYVVGNKARSEHHRLRGEIREHGGLGMTPPLPLPTDANLFGWGLSAVLFLILLMALSCVTFLAPSSRDLGAAITWWGILAFVAVMFGISFRNYRYVRRAIDH